MATKSIIGQKREQSPIDRENDFMMNNHYPQNGLTPEKLQFFIAGLSGLSADEVRKAKILFLRNEISQLRAFKTSLEGFGAAQGCFSFIPIFWPVLRAQKSTMNAGLQLQKDQIRNALAVWRDDIGDEARRIESELDSL